jgi:hypothetical protein
MRDIPPGPAYSFFLALLLALFLSCSGDVPRISQTDWMVVHTDDRDLGIRREEISLYVLAEDPDGNEDLKKLSLSNEKEEYIWSFERDTWNSRPSGNALWIGQNRIIPNGDRFSDGNYRITLEDGAGRTATTDIYLAQNRLKTDQISFPDVSMSGSTLIVNGNYPQYMIWLYDEGGNLLHSRYIRNGRYALGELMEGKPEQPASCWLFIFIEEKYTGIKTGPFYFVR